MAGELSDETLVRPIGFGPLLELYKKIRVGLRLWRTHARIYSCQCKTLFVLHLPLPRILIRSTVMASSKELVSRPGYKLASAKHATEMALEQGYSQLDW